ncbi:SO2930 family diheme c-type cytochrome [Pontibacter sp. G13]|uniref:SO2930 family diheme c-type cytochrome n=1 Tax=Pontibacter sp. G13 TaxID=3074898 RepID=UPI0028892E95|nr:SO2930 family diheme c-type cytochrome [Pontibacter sp. G13]WNJ16691.1 SO2930 family diheme c-type cytochrome [Pontibacter sp. G13]
MKLPKALLRMMALSAVLILIVGFAEKPQDLPEGVHMKLSDYGFFQGEMAQLDPVNGVVPYDLNTPLFSDYAWKQRFVKLPEGASVDFNDHEVLDFPVGTVLIKTFYYPHDERNPEKGRQLLETRLLIHQEAGWRAVPYHWNDDQTEAYLEVAGGRKQISWKDSKGKKQKLEYVMPNQNQCKGCHSFKGAMRPIGPSARQLNGEYAFAHGTQNQLEHWKAQNMMTNLPEDWSKVPKAPVWDDPSTGSIDERARIWLDINCAHCHNEHGPASTSGLFLDIHQDDPYIWGIHKSPVAAGRGSGGLLYDIIPGDPNSSILMLRIESEDPGVMMPEVGRKVVHKESAELINDWIQQMDPKDYPRP